MVHATPTEDRRLLLLHLLFLIIIPYNDPTAVCTKENDTERALDS